MITLTVLNKRLLLSTIRKQWWGLFTPGIWTPLIGCGYSNPCRRKEAEFMLSMKCKFLWTDIKCFWFTVCTSVLFYKCEYLKFHKHPASVLSMFWSCHLFNLNTFPGHQDLNLTLFLKLKEKQKKRNFFNQIFILLCIYTVYI